MKNCDDETAATARRKTYLSKLSYPGYKADLKEADIAHECGKTWRYERLMQKLRKKQRAYEGDRSHQQLKALDALGLSYPGWEEDFNSLENMHFEFGGKFFWDKLEGLKNKQRSFLEDRSHPNLFNLDSIYATYPGKNEDFARAEDAHFNGNQRRFERLLYKIEKKQRVYEGDRSHPQLAALDRLVLSYPGWTDDFYDAELTHYEHEGQLFWDKLEGLKCKQQIYDGNRSHPNLVQLDSMHLTYPGWEVDFKKAEDAHKCGNDWRFQRLVERMVKKESGVCAIDCDETNHNRSDSTYRRKSIKKQKMLPRKKGTEGTIPSSTALSKKIKDLKHECIARIA